MRTVALGEVAGLGSGGTPKRSVSEYFGPGIPWLSIADLNDGVVVSAKESLTDAGIANSAAKVVPPGTLLVAMYGSIGKLAIAGTELCTSQAIAFVRPDESILDRSYLFHYLLAQRPRLQKLGRGGTQMNISQGDLKKWPVPLPLLDEQRRIAAILDHADSVRAKRRSVLQQQRDLPRAVFADMFGRWNGPCATIAEVALPEKGSIRTGPFGSQLLHSEFVDQGIAVLGLDNVVGNEFTWGKRRYITAEKYEALRRYTVRPGDVLMSIMGTCGRCVVVPSEIETSINTKHICAITVDRGKALPDFVRAAFLWHPMSRQFLARMTKGSIMDGLNMGIIKQTPIPLPDIDSQQVFVDQAKVIDQCTRVSADLQTKSDELFASIQARAFQGEL